MSDPAKAILATSSDPDDAQSLTRLLANLATSARHGVNTALVGRSDAGQWETLNHAIDRRMRRKSWDAGAFSREATPVIEAAARRLQRIDRARAAAYVDMCESLAAWRHSCSHVVSPSVVAEHLVHALLWHSAWHLLTAGLGVGDVIGIVTIPPRRPLSSQPIAALPAAGQSATRSVTGRTSSVDVGPRQQRSREILQVGTRAAGASLRASASVISWVGVTVWSWAHRTWQGRQRTKAELRERIRQQTEAVKAAQKAEAEREAARIELERQETTRREAEAAAQRAVNAEAIFVAVPTMAVDGRRLCSSVVSTWFGLVFFSWVSLIWGGLISLPFGVGLEVFATLFAGLIAVPLWGTVFGFIGMMPARDSTMGAFKFKELPEDHPLRATCARFAEALDLPMPKLGTVDVHNAFAMGANERMATVAIGTPLLEQLTTEEVNAVLGHELGHVVSGDMKRMMLMRTFQNATVWYMMIQGAKQFVRWIICWAAELFILAFSRNREYWADAIGAALAGKDAMIGALRKLESAPALTGNERTHARFMFRAGSLSTHPSMPQRIKALEDETYIKRLPQKRS